MPTSTIGKQLHAVRAKRLITIEELSRKSHVGVGTISELETGKADPRISTVIKLAQAMGGKFKLSF